MSKTSPVNVKPNAMALYQLLTGIFLLLDDVDRQVLRQHSLSVRQYSALYHLDTERGLSINDLSKRLICDKSNTTRLVERLKQEGLVIREQDQIDRRFVSVRITEKGDSIRQEALIAHQKSVDARFESLAQNDQATLRQLLSRLRDGLNEQINQVSFQ